ncbi:MAG: MFS transporter [Nitrososphaerales archaeon]
MTASSKERFSPSSSRLVVLGIVSIGFFMIPFDGSVVNVALPSIAVSLRATLGAIVWIPTAYLLVFAALETTIGRLGDMRGKKKLYLISVGIFTAGSLAAGLSASILELILARVTQGIGGAGMDAIGFSLLTTAFSGGNRGRAFGISSMIIYIGLCSGPAIGGVLVQVFGWRSIFYVNVPIGIAGVILALLFLKRDEVARDARQGFDFLGAFTLTGFLTTLLLILNGQDLRLAEAASILLDGACLAFVFSFIYVESKIAETPLLDLRLFTHNRLFAGGSATALMNYMTVYGTLFLLSLYLQSILGYSPVKAGVILLAQPIFMAISSPIAGILSDRVSARILVSFGMASKAVAFFFLSFLGSHSSPESVIIPLVVVGIGHGFFSSPNLNSVMSSVDPKRFGIASGMMGTIRQSAQSIGIAVLGGIVAAHLPAGSLNVYASSTLLTGGLAVDFVGGVNIAFLAASAICAVGVFTSLIRGKKAEPSPDEVQRL